MKVQLQKAYNLVKMWVFAKFLLIVYTGSSFDTKKKLQKKANNSHEKKRVK